MGFGVSALTLGSGLGFEAEGLVFVEAGLGAKGVRLAHSLEAGTDL